MHQEPQTGISSSLASADMLLILVALTHLAKDVILGIQHVLLLMILRQAYQAQVVHRAWENRKSLEPRARSGLTGIEADIETAKDTHLRHLLGCALSRQLLVEAGVPKPAVLPVVGAH